MAQFPYVSIECSAHFTALSHLEGAGAGPQDLREARLRAELATTAAGRSLSESQEEFLTEEEKPAAKIQCEKHQSHEYPWLQTSVTVLMSHASETLRRVGLETVNAGSLSPGVSRPWALGPALAVPACALGVRGRR